MHEFDVRAPAKVNLSLDVLGKREDGYHEMRMINHSIALSDTLRFCPSASEIRLSCSDAAIPADERNLVFKIANRLRQEFHVSQGAGIHIEKRIPSQAGLAGGSADGAAAIIGLNRLWQLDMSLGDMCALAATVGADIPYCCFKGTALVEGIGERITPIKPLGRLPLVVVKPDVNIATPWAFGLLDTSDDGGHPDIDGVIRCVEAEDYRGLGRVVGNVFEPVVTARYPIVGAIKEKLLGFGAAASLMSGSGSTVVGYFEDQATAQKAFDALAAQDGLRVFLTEVA